MSYREITLKQWVIEEAAREGVKPHAIECRRNRGKYPALTLRKVNKRVIFVQLPAVSLPMNPIVTVILSEGAQSQQTQFCYSQRNTPEARAAIETLHARLVASLPKQPKHVNCTDGSVRVRKHW